MAQYVVQVRSKGAVTAIDITANTPDIAKKLAKRYGIPLTVSKKRASFKSRGLSQSERYIFLIRLSTMLASKVGSAEALRLIRDSFGGKISGVAAGMLEKVELGMDLPAALIEDTKNFPTAMAMIVRAGAQTGQTWRALQEAAEFEKEIFDLKQGSKNGMLGAMGSFMFAGALLVFSTFYLGPKVMSMGLMKDNADKIDNSLVDALSYIGGGFMLIIMTIFAAGFWLATVGRRFWPTTADNIITKIPYYCELVLAQQNYTNLYRLSLMVRSGVRMEEALQTAHESCGRGALKIDFERSIGALKSGKKWASAMSILHPTDRAALMLAADRDQIATNLNNIAAQYNSIYKQRIGAFTPTLKVLSAFAMSLSGFVLFAQTTMPMLQLSANMMSN